MKTYQVCDKGEDTWLPEEGTTHLGSIIECLTIPGTRVRLKDDKSGNPPLSETAILFDIFQKEDAAIRSNYRGGLYDLEGFCQTMRDLWSAWAKFQEWKAKAGNAES